MSKNDLIDSVIDCVFDSLKEFRISVGGKFLPFTIDVQNKLININTASNNLNSKSSMYQAKLNLEQTIQNLISEFEKNYNQTVDDIRFATISTISGFDSYEQQPCIQINLRNEIPIYNY